MGAFEDCGTCGKCCNQFDDDPDTSTIPIGQFPWLMHKGIASDEDRQMLKTTLRMTPLLDPAIEFRKVACLRVFYEENGKIKKIDYTRNSCADKTGSAARLQQRRRMKGRFINSPNSVPSYVIPGCGHYGFKTNEIKRITDNGIMMSGLPIDELTKLAEDEYKPE